MAPILLAAALAPAYAQQNAPLTAQPGLPVRLKPVAVPISSVALSQIAALEQAKALRTPAQNKIDSQLLYAIQGMDATQGVNVPQTAVAADVSGLVEVDITALITPGLLDEIAALGGVVVNAFPQDSAARARLPLSQMEALAADPAVRFIRPAELGGVVRTQRTAPVPAVAQPLVPRIAVSENRAARLARTRQFLLSALSEDHFPTLLPSPGGSKSAPSASLFAELGGPGVGSVSMQGDITHRANLARSAFAVDGTGIKIAVLSDSVDNSVGSYAAAVTSGDVGPVTVVPGQSGGQQSAEGLAMLEIVHHIAPGAQLFFATAGGGQANFANNIRTLRNTYGCDIIIDDYFYYAEAPFQDGTVAKAVDDVTASGALYFASAGNAGSLDAGTAGVWEGDFADGGAAGAPISSVEAGRLHSFGALTYDTITANSSDNEDHLFWSDPLGAAGDDYDLFLLSADGTSVVRASTNTQAGTQDPFEYISPAGTVNQRLVVVLYKGSGRYLHMDTGPVNGGRLSIGTSGQTKGHSAALAAFGVAAVDVHTTSPFPSAFTSADPTIYFSSDGLRRIFYNPDGSAITPGNFSSTGGTLLRKPEITAANGVSTTLPASSGLNPFYGTSAASPHAGAIAGLMKQYNPALTQPQVRAVLTGPAAIDNDAPGYDRDAGYGIIDAYSALSSIAYSISGQITAQNGTAISGVTLTASGPSGMTATTDAFGNFVFNGLPLNALGTYTLTPFKAGFGFYPASVTLTVGPSASGQNFVLSQPGIRTSINGITRSATEYVVTAVLANGGPSASGLLVTRATLGPVASPSVPLSAGTLATGGAAAVVLHFPLTAGATGATVALRLSGTQTGGSFGGSLFVTLP